MSAVPARSAKSARGGITSDTPRDALPPAPWPITPTTQRYTPVRSAAHQDSTAAGAARGARLGGRDRSRRPPARSGAAPAAEADHPLLPRSQPRAAPRQQPLPRPRKAPRTRGTLTPCPLAADAAPNAAVRSPSSPGDSRDTIRPARATTACSSPAPAPAARPNSTRPNRRWTAMSSLRSPANYPCSSTVQTAATVPGAPARPETPSPATLSSQPPT
jgi:hypothetical protein